MPRPKKSDQARRGRLFACRLCGEAVTNIVMFRDERAVALCRGKCRGRNRVEVRMEVECGG